MHIHMDASTDVSCAAGASIMGGGGRGGHHNMLRPPKITVVRFKTSMTNPKSLSRSASVTKP